jgi:hypothetical protein
MSRRLAPIAAALLVLAACGTDHPADSGAASEPTTSPLEGTWTTDLTHEALLAYIHHAGWSKKVEKALLGPKMAGPSASELRVDFVGETFRMSRVTTDEQMQSGVFWIEDDRIYLDDEAPVGELTFALHLDGDTATYDEPADTSDPDNEQEYVDGAPVWAPGAVLWASTTWTRADS